MKYIKKEFEFDSMSGLCKIHAASYLPLDGVQIKAIFQIAHGMTEHFERYEKFIEKLCLNGFAVYANDHLGHGLSVASEADLGYFGEKDGWKNFIDDAHTLTDIARQELPDKPVIFFGHSMGSFIARQYSFKYSEEIAGAVFCGTAPPNPAIPLAKAFLATVQKITGSKRKFKLINKVAFGAYNSKFEGSTDYEWLSRDRQVIDDYLADKHCGFLFTVSGYKDLMGILGEVSKKQWFENFSKTLPILFISGDKDPVGNYKKGVRLVCDKLVAAGKENIHISFYGNARHEILNDSACVEQVYATVLEWADEVLEKTPAVVK